MTATKSTKSTKSKWIASGLTLALGAGVVGCESNAGNGALIGGATGAGVGGLIGSFSHARAGEGALIGGAIGAAGGALIGNAADQQERQQYRRYSEPRYYDDGYRYDEPRPRRPIRHRDDDCD